MTREEARREIDSLDFYLQNHTDDYGEESHTAMMMAIKALEQEPKTGRWIPVSERLPEERDWYLAVFEEVDTGFIGLPYIADYLMGKNTIYTTEDGWIIHNCTDIEGGASEYYKKLRCVAWQPLPEPHKAESKVGKNDGEIFI